MTLRIHASTSLAFLYVLYCIVSVKKIFKTPECGTGDRNSQTLVRVHCQFTGGQNVYNKKYPLSVPSHWSTKILISSDPQPMCTEHAYRMFVRPTQSSYFTSDMYYTANSGKG